MSPQPRAPRLYRSALIPEMASGRPSKTAGSSKAGGVNSDQTIGNVFRWEVLFGSLTV